MGISLGCSCERHDVEDGAEGAIKTILVVDEAAVSQTTTPLPNNTFLAVTQESTQLEASSKLGNVEGTTPRHLCSAKLWIGIDRLVESHKLKARHWGFGLTELGENDEEIFDHVYEVTGENVETTHMSVVWSKSCVGSRTGVILDGGIVAHQPHVFPSRSKARNKAEYDGYLPLVVAGTVQVDLERINAEVGSWVALNPIYDFLNGSGADGGKNCQQFCLEIYEFITGKTLDLTTDVERADRVLAERNELRPQADLPLARIPSQLPEYVNQNAQTQKPSSEELAVDSNTVGILSLQEPPGQNLNDCAAQVQEKVTPKKSPKKMAKKIPKKADTAMDEKAAQKKGSEETVPKAPPKAKAKSRLQSRPPRLTIEQASKAIGEAKPVLQKPENMRRLKKEIANCKSDDELQEMMNMAETLLPIVWDMIGNVFKKYGFTDQKQMLGALLQIKMLARKDENLRVEVEMVMKMLGQKM